MGEVPAETPAIPLAQDLARTQKSLRLKPSAEIKMLDLDLRNDTDLKRSQLFHRLKLLAVSWGERKPGGSHVSTFHEIWKIEWKPELAVAVIEAGIWGTTIPAAATAKALSVASNAELPEITTVLDTVILAGLSDAIAPLLTQLQARAAVAADIRHLMEALPPLARVARYGDVRQTSATHVEPILVEMFERALVGLPAACTSLDDDASQRMLTSMDAVQEALNVLAREDLSREWQERLRELTQGSIHPLLRGACCRRLLEQEVIDAVELGRLASLALSPTLPPGDVAAWLNGLLRGSGMGLLHQDALWQVMDLWLAGLPADVFTEMLPLVRRSFSGFSPAERRQMGDKMKRLSSTNGAAAHLPPTVSVELHPARSRLPLPVLAHILGVTLDEATSL